MQFPSHISTAKPNTSTTTSLLALNVSQSVVHRFMPVPHVQRRSDGAHVYGPGAPSRPSVLQCCFNRDAMCAMLHLQGPQLPTLRALWHMCRGFGDPLKGHCTLR